MMPLSYDGDEDVYYQDWEAFEGRGDKGEVVFVERPNHGLASAMRKALLVQPVRHDPTLPSHGAPPARPMGRPPSSSLCARACPARAFIC